MRLSGKVAIIAGAGWGGIGAATAYRFAQEGAKVVVNGLPGEERLHETVAQIKRIGADVAVVEGDVAESCTWQTLVETTQQHFDRIDILVHSAASSVLARAAEITDADWDRSLAVTLRGPLLGVRHCVPEMVKVGGGSIVFISTVNSFITNPRFGVYSVAKAGLNALMRSVALDHGRDGIRCNAIAPGQIVGARNRHLVDDPLEDQLSRDCYPLGRYGRPDEIAACALFLASDDASFVTGSLLVADGGLTIQSPEALVRPSFRARWRDDILRPSKPETSSE